MSGSRKFKVFYSNVDAFGDDSIPDLLVDDDSNGSGVDVENSTSPSVVVLIRHSLVDSTIYNDIDNVADLIAGESLGDVNRSMLLESFSEFVSCSSLVSVAMGHEW